MALVGSANASIHAGRLPSRASQRAIVTGCRICSHLIAATPHASTSMPRCGVTTWMKMYRHLPNIHLWHVTTGLVERLCCALQWHLLRLSIRKNCYQRDLVRFLYPIRYVDTPHMHHNKMYVKRGCTHRMARAELQKVQPQD
jgi:hypothetical protein